MVEENDVLVLPAQIQVLRVLIGLQLYSLVGVSLLQFAGTLPSAFDIPDTSWSVSYFGYRRFIERVFERCVSKPPSAAQVVCDLHL